MSLIDSIYPAERLEEYTQKIDAIYEWIECGDAPYGFDDSFINSMLERLEKEESLTPNQEAAIDRIIDGFRIDF